MYKVMLVPPAKTEVCIWRVEDSASIPVNNDNTDYQNFKSQINADEAQLEDADGNLMTPEAAKAFVKELP